MNLPNVLTSVRIVLAPLIALLLFQSSVALRFAAFGVFLVAAVSDLWDGYLARSQGLTSDFGKVADPTADKIVLLACLLPLYLLTARRPHLAGLPLFGSIPLWAVIVLLAREALVTLMRFVAARRGVVMAAARIGKHKAFSQNVFLGTGILWLAFRSGTGPGGWTGPGWEAWMTVLGWACVSFLVVAVLLTAYSMVAYAVSFDRSWPAREADSSP